MHPTDNMPPPIRERARVICVTCHARKVKCDLQNSPDGTCSNCHRNSQNCIASRRDGLRKKKMTARKQNREAPEAVHSCENDGLDSVVQERGILSPAHSAVSTAPRDHQLRHHPHTHTYDSGFIADHSELSQAEVILGTGPNTLQNTDGVSGVTEASGLPREPLLQALVDSYFDNLFHFFPMIDRHDLIGSDTSKLLLQSVCLAGSLMRQMGDTKDFELSQTIYIKVKALVYSGLEKDSLALLKALCLMSVWSPSPPSFVTLDGPWHWTGVAIRLAFQMGLHKESTYANKVDAGCRRRIWWQLYMSDIIQAACWGRPVAIPSNDFDVCLPTVIDFETQDIQSKVFIYSLKLHIIIGKISEIRSKRQSMAPDALPRLTEMLLEWLNSLPEELRLFDFTGTRRPYYRPVCEIHILYFNTIIFIQSLQRPKDGPRRTSLPSLIASSCTVSLYEEIYLRQHAHFLLHIHGFFIMVAAVSQIYHHPVTLTKLDAQKQEFEVLFSVLRQMRCKYGGADMVLNKISWLQVEVEKVRKREFANSQRENVQQDAWGYSAPNQESLQDLFPFPANLCANMDLLNMSTTEDSGISFSDILPRGDEVVPSAYDEETFFTDMFGMDIDIFNSTYVAADALHIQPT